MGFVQASLLAALAAVALPVIAHLIFRRRARPVDLGTLRFLKVAVRRDTRRRWLKRWLLLALRVGCVVLLVLMFARPYRAQTIGGGDTGLTVILIDRSASMARQRDGERLVEHAIKQLPAVVARIPSRSRVEVAWFDKKVEPIGSSDDGRVSIADLKAPEALVGGTDFAAALTWAGARCEAARGSGPLSVHVFTDRQRTGFGSLEGFAFPKDVPVQVWDIGPAAAVNIAVTEVRPNSLIVRAEHSTTVQATILNSTPEPIEQRPVRLTLANQSRVITLPGVASAGPGASTTVTFETPQLGEGLWQGTVSIDGGDGLPLDDARHVAVYAAAKPRVRAIRENDHAERAVGRLFAGRGQPQGGFQVIRVAQRRDIAGRTIE
jgi:hypothetical protein